MIHLLNNKKRNFYVSLALASIIFISSCKEAKKNTDKPSKNDTTMELQNQILLLFIWTI